MKKPNRRIVQRDEPLAGWRDEVCDNCAYGTWNTIHWNLDQQGRPITLRCPSYKDGKVGILRGTKACERFNRRNAQGMA